MLSLVDPVDPELDDVETIRDGTSVQNMTHAPSPKSDSGNTTGTGTDGEEDIEYTVEEAVNAMGYGRFQFKVAFIVGFNTMADAFEIMLVSVLSDKLRCDWQLSPWQQAMITTFVFGGYFLGSPLWGLMGDKFGRKKTLILAAFNIFYFGFLSSFSPNLSWMLFLRGLVGFSLGGASQGWIIITEFLPSKNRGLFLSCMSFFWVTGMCLEISLAMLLLPTLGWRYLLVFSSLPLLMFLILASRFLPESALYNQASGNLTGAMETLKQISRLNRRPLPPGTLKKHVHMKARGSIKELFKTKTLVISTCLLIALWFCNAFLYYGNVLLSTELFSSGETCVSKPSKPGLECFAVCKSLDVMGYAEILLTSLAEFPGMILTLIVIDFLGRRWSMGGQMLIAALFCFLLLLCTSSQIQVAFVFINRALVAGAFQVLYVYTPEVFPTHVRSVALGLCVAASRFGAIVTPFVAQVMTKHSVAATVCVYGGFTLLASLICVILPLETKGTILH